MGWFKKCLEEKEAESAGNLKFNFDAKGKKNGLGRFIQSKTRREKIC